MKTSFTARLASFAFAALLTAGTLAGINGLAVNHTPDAADALLARVVASQQG